MRRAETALNRSAAGTAVLLLLDWQTWRRAQSSRTSQHSIYLKRLSCTGLWRQDLLLSPFCPFLFPKHSSKLLLLGLKGLEGARGQLWKCLSVNYVPECVLIMARAYHRQLYVVGVTARPGVLVYMCVCNRDAVVLSASRGKLWQDKPRALGPLRVCSTAVLLE